MEWAKLDHVVVAAAICQWLQINVSFLYTFCCDTLEANLEATVAVG